MTAVKAGIELLLTVRAAMRILQIRLRVHEYYSAVQGGSVRFLVP